MNDAEALSEPIPESLFDAGSQARVSEAIGRIRLDLKRYTPESASQTIEWMERQSAPGCPELSFRGLKAHFLVIPRYYETQLRGGVDEELQRQLVYSSINGYYFARLLDNVSDGHASADATLLPIAAMFHSNFQSAYFRLFPPANPFWEMFQELWAGMADATIRNAQLATVSHADFAKITSRKIAGAKIPVAAIGFRYGDRQLEQWLDFYDCFICAHEMLDDLCDWLSDMAAGRRTFLLSEAEARKDAGESVTTYLCRIGLSKGYARIVDWLKEAESRSCNLHCPQLTQFVLFRRSQIERVWNSMVPHLQQLSTLGRELEGMRHGSI